MLVDVAAHAMTAVALETVPAALATITGKGCLAQQVETIYLMEKLQGTNVCIVAESPVAIRLELSHLGGVRRGIRSEAATAASQFYYSPVIYTSPFSYYSFFQLEIAELGINAR